MQDDEAATFPENVPAGHMEQTVLLAPINPSMHVQSVIWVLPVGDMELIGHEIHAVSDVEPETLLKVPALHDVQFNSEDEPTTLENVPKTQSMQPVAPVVLTCFPASHLEHTVELMEAENVPSAHGMQRPSTVNDVFNMKPE